VDWTVLLHNGANVSTAGYRGRYETRWGGQRGDLCRVLGLGAGPHAGARRGGCIRQIARTQILRLDGVGVKARHHRLVSAALLTQLYTD